MLVLSRKLGEEIVIGENIRISVLRNQGGRVRLGITAPPSVAIARMEIVHIDDPRRLSDSRTTDHDRSSTHLKGGHRVRKNTAPGKPR